MTTWTLFPYICWVRLWHVTRVSVVNNLIWLSWVLRVFIINNHIRFVTAHAARDLGTWIASPSMMAMCDHMTFLIAVWIFIILFAFFLHNWVVVNVLRYNSWWSRRKTAATVLMNLLEMASTFRMNLNILIWTKVFLVCLGCLLLNSLFILNRLNRRAVWAAFAIIVVEIFVSLLAASSTYSHLNYTVSIWINY